MGATSASLDQIIALNLETTGRDTLSSVSGFASKYKNQRSIDGQGQNEPSILTSTITDYINEAVEEEFKGYAEVSK